MAINLLETYDLLDLSSDYRLTHFNTLSNGQPVRLRAYISNVPHLFMPDVYNLSFGPPVAGSEYAVDDKAEVKHDNIDKLLSTLLFFAYSYLDGNRTHYVGIDGSCNLRAALYYRKLQYNYAILTGHFSVIAGNKYYIRFKRFNKPAETVGDETAQLLALAEGIKNNLDYSNIIALPEVIDPGLRMTIDSNFNYFTFKI